MAQRFNLYPSSGPALLAVLVHGSGGPTDASALRKATVQHERGRLVRGLVQPIPGHIAAYAMSDRSDERAVPLDGLRWEVTP